MGNVDLFHSRRTNYHKCTYWVRDERNTTGTASEWILNNQPDGRFYAKIVSSKINRMETVSNVWAFDSNRITIETDDHIDSIKRGCLVKFDDMLWLVEMVQKEIHHKESEFSKRIDYRYIISLVRS